MSVEESTSNAATEHTECIIEDLNGQGDDITLPFPNIVSR
jgi:hypothetical protein